MTASPTDPAAGVSPVRRRAASAAVRSGPATPISPPGVAGGTTSPAAKDRRHDATAAGDPSSPQPSERQAAETPGPETAPAPPLLGAAADRARDNSPAGASLKAHGSHPAGTRGLRGKDFRDAMKRAQAKGRPRPAASSKRPAPAAPEPGPLVSGDGLTATAHCIRGCEWTAGPGSAADVDRAADKHTTKPPKHPTAVVAELTAGAA